jgi:hypothetical protein
MNKMLDCLRPVSRCRVSRLLTLSTQEIEVKILPYTNYD